MAQSPASVAAGIDPGPVMYTLLHSSLTRCGSIKERRAVAERRAQLPQQLPCVVILQGLELGNSKLASTSRAGGGWTSKTSLRCWGQGRHFGLNATYALPWSIIPSWVSSSSWDNSSSSSADREPGPVPRDLVLRSCPYSTSSALHRRSNLLRTTCGCLLSKVWTVRGVNLW